MFMSTNTVPLDVHVNEAQPSYDTSETNRIRCVMVSVLALNVVDRGFEPRSSQTKDLVFVASPLSTQH